jgi:hypothetical protein
VLIGKGDGSFTATAKPAFPLIQSAFSEGPNLAAGDLNNDGKLDLVLSTGYSILTWIGNGDGTFTQGHGYASINDTGFVTVTDLDGDGNADIYVGLANGGVYSGDDSSPASAYFLMGNGDGTFQGAPALSTGSYNGNNLADLNGDGVLDLVTLNDGLGLQTTPAGSLTVQLGTGTGAFVKSANIAPQATFTINGYNFTMGSAAQATSFAIGDVNGDGKPDVVFVDNNLTVINPGSGFLITYPYPVYFVALGNGDGTFQTAVPHAFPQIAPAADFDNTVIASDVRIADFRHDGRADLMFVYDETAGGSGVNPYNRGFAVLPGNGDGTFQAPVLTSTYSSTTAPTAAAVPQIRSVVDLNGDSKPDLIVNASGTTIINFQLQTQLQVFVSNGDGTFKAPVTAAVGADTYSIPVLADFNKDGKLDMAVLAETALGQAELVILPGQGDGTFGTAAVSNLVGGDSIRSAGLAAADFDGDGNVDLALIDSQDFGGIFYGKGDGTFSSIPFNGNIIPKDLINITAGAPAIAIDLNGDGKPDILAGSVSLLSASMPSTLASTTTALSASQTSINSGSSVTFTATITAASGSTGTPSGTVTFLDGTTTLGPGTISSGVATYTTSVLSVGAHSITANYAGDTNFSGSTSSAVSITVNGVTVPIGTTTNLSSSASTAVSGTNITFTSTVAPASGTATPTGTVTFADGSTTLETGTLDSTGKATYSTTALATGAHSITAAYGGDANFSGSTSAAVSITITAPVPPGFTLSLSPASGTASNGIATSTVNVSPTGGFNQAVTLSCSAAPKNSTCDISPSPITPNSASPATATMTIKINVKPTATAQNAGPRGSRRAGQTASLAFLGGGVIFGCMLFCQRRRTRWLIQLGVASLLAASVITGCVTSGSKTPKGTYALTVTGTAGSNSQSATYSLIVK